MTKIISLFILKAVFVTVSYSANNLIETTCKRIPYLDLCVSTLKPYPLSSIAVIKGLACIWVIEAIEKGNLKFAVEGNLKFAIKSAVGAGNKDQGGVGESQAGNEAQRCRNSFGKRRRTPISYRNKAVHDLSAVLQSIASLLL
ncbi:hypothetical protein Goari_003245 [Gossypium aridum]|uniref:Pectinesterase inhibitor domain-containing protein n=1 Tax=Gossypium aridum TaxID=34290 RepID=A0A7J8YAU4_GOSAI|nr:hypothetical protein [Gossypium aridum]